jgi:hypothetical protein
MNGRLAGANGSEEEEYDLPWVNHRTVQVTPRPVEYWGCPTIIGRSSVVFALIGTCGYTFHL